MSTGRELAAYAADERRSRGRRYDEDPPALRGEFQRDRDRVIHSGAFRRLEYKTQVFVNHEGDLYRTRLTHSLEVAQIARTAARAMRLNEDLVEAISLAHDLGHTPFGHAGQDALNECMREFGGFEHNLQSLRVVDVLEERYAHFPGLNLTFETREGILKHCSSKRARELGDVGQRFLDRRQPSLEAQLVNLADEIAYNNHDVDDGLRAGLITLEQLANVSFVAEQLDWVRRRYPQVDDRRLGYEVVRRMIAVLVADLVSSSEQAIATAAPRSIDDVRSLRQPLIGFGERLADAHVSLKRFLHEHLYRHPHVRRMTEHARETIGLLFAAFREDYARMPPEHAMLALDRSREKGEAGGARVVSDYIAGMTDRFALQARTAIESGRAVDTTPAAAAVEDKDRG